MGVFTVFSIMAFFSILTLPGFLLSMKDSPVQLRASVALMLVQSILNCGDSVLSLTTETKGRGSSLSLRWKRIRLLERKNRPGAKEVLARSAMRPRPRRYQPEVPGSQDRLRREVGLMGGREKREGSEIRPKGYLLGLAVLMFWLLFVFFRSTLSSFGFSLSHLPAPVLLLRPDKQSFLALKCCSHLSPRQANAYFSEWHLQRQVAQHL